MEVVAKQCTRHQNICQIEFDVMLRNEVISSSRRQVLVAKDPLSIFSLGDPVYSLSCHRGVCHSMKSRTFTLQSWSEISDLRQYNEIHDC